MNNAVGGYIDSVPISAEEVITTLRSDHICVLNLNDTSGIAATCDEYGGGDPVSMAHIVTGWQAAHSRYRRRTPHIHTR